MSRIYFFSNGIANCIDAKTGNKIYQSRLEGAAGAAHRGGADSGRSGGGGGGGRGGRGGQDYSSPIIADGKVYFTSRSGNMFVLRASDKFEQMATNHVTSDSEDFSATPAVSDGQLFIRSDKHLYCIAAP